jgi:hypothetical protein
VNGLSPLRSIVYGAKALSASASDLLFEARIALLNQPWLGLGGPKSTGYYTENNDEPWFDLRFLGSVDWLAFRSTPAASRCFMFASDAV